MAYIHSIHFTLTEAQDFLTDVVQMLRQMRSLKHALDAKNYNINVHRYFGGTITNGVKEYPDEMRELMNTFHRLIGLGVVIRDIERGLIDFPTIRDNGEEAYLCYVLDEPQIMYWHPINEGYSGRRPMDTL